MTELFRAGLLTGGGDAPALNAVIRAITIAGSNLGWRIIGFKEGWAGVLEKRFEFLIPEEVAQIHRFGGCKIFNSRTPLSPKKQGAPNLAPKAAKNLTELDINVLFGIGGDDTLGELNTLYQEGLFTRVIGVPKTIDNDVDATDYTFGFQTAAERVMEALERLHTTAHAHHRVIIVEIMGRHAGWMALEGGLAGGAHYIATPESGLDLDRIREIIIERYQRKDPDNWYAIIAIAEGAESAQLKEWLSSAQKAVIDACTKQGVDPKLVKRVIKSPDLDPFGHIYLAKIGLADAVAKYIEENLRPEIEKIRREIPKFECRPVVLGHLQRAGHPLAFDRNLGLRLGLKAVELAKNNLFGIMVALKGTEIVPVPLAEALQNPKKVPLARLQEAEIFFGY